MGDGICSMMELVAVRLRDHLTPPLPVPQACSSLLLFTRRPVSFWPFSLVFIPTPSLLPTLPVPQAISPLHLSLPPLTHSPKARPFSHLIGLPPHTPSQPQANHILSIPLSTGGPFLPALAPAPRLSSNRIQIVKLASWSSGHGRHMPIKT